MRVDGGAPRAAASGPQARGQEDDEVAPARGDGGDHRGQLSPRPLGWRATAPGGASSGGALLRLRFVRHDLPQGVHFSSCLAFPRAAGPTDISLSGSAVA